MKNMSMQSDTTPTFALELADDSMTKWNDSSVKFAPTRNVSENLIRLRKTFQPRFSICGHFSEQTGPHLDCRRDEMKRRPGYWRKRLA